MSTENQLFIQDTIADFITNATNGKAAFLNTGTIQEFGLMSADVISICTPMRYWDGAQYVYNDIQTGLGKYYGVPANSRFEFGDEMITLKNAGLTIDQDLTVSGGLVAAMYGLTAYSTVGFTQVAIASTVSEHALRLTANTGKAASILFWENAVNHNWAVGTRAADTTLYFASGDDLISGTDRMSLSAAGVLTVGNIRLTSAPLAVAGLCGTVGYDPSTGEVGFVAQGKDATTQGLFDFTVKESDLGTPMHGLRIGTDGLINIGDQLKTTAFTAQVRVCGPGPSANKISLMNTTDPTKEIASLKQDYSGGSGSGELWLNNSSGANIISLVCAGTSSIDGALTINESGANVDMRVEGDTDANLLFTDASTDRIGVGTNAPSAKLTVNGDFVCGGSNCNELRHRIRSSEAAYYQEWTTDQNPWPWLNLFTPGQLEGGVIEVILEQTGGASYKTYARIRYFKPTTTVIFVTTDIVGDAFALTIAIEDNSGAIRIKALGVDGTGSPANMYVHVYRCLPEVHFL
jgi:hypothetical protein